MMADILLDPLRVGDIRNEIFTLTASAGTETFNGTPTYRVLDSIGTVLSSGNVDNVSGSGTATVSIAKALNTNTANTGGAALTAGTYILEITAATILSADSATPGRTYVKCAGFRICA